MPKLDQFFWNLTFPVKATSESLMQNQVKSFLKRVSQEFFINQMATNKGMGQIFYLILFASHA